MMMMDGWKLCLLIMFVYFLILSDTENHQVFLFDPTVVINYLYCLISDNIFMRYLRFYPDINNQVKLFFYLHKESFFTFIGL